MSGQTPVEVSDTEHLVLASDDKQSSSSERSSAHLSTNQAESKIVLLCMSIFVFIWVCL